MTMPTRPDPFLLPWVRYGPPIEVVVNAPVTPVAVAHRLGVVPTGYLVVLQTGAVYAAQVEQWTSDLAWFTSPSLATVRLIFFTIREDLIRAK